MRLKGNNGQISTGWPSMDKRLFGGMNRGELNIFAGGSGSGKSLFMQNLSLNWVLAGLNGIYLSLELSEDLCAMRLDSMLTSVPSKDIFRELDTVEMKVKVISKKAGNLWIKYMPAQSNVNHFRAYIKELQVQHNVKPDFICVDYLDLVMPVSAKVSPNDLFVKDKYVSEELRNLAKELNILLVTASQLNRSAVEEVEFDHSHISGGISKINTADNVFGIFTSRAMRERGRYQLQLMKTRSSSGVGSKIDLEFNLESLRIIDTEQEGDAGYRAPQTQSSGILDQIKNKSTALPAPETGKINAEVNSSRLKGMLASLRQGNQPG
jgi:archaellum biogenesis ATPase FlaH